MKTAKLVIGVLSIVLTMVVLFQSCAATVGDALANEGGTSGGVGIAARNSRGGSIFCIIAYALAGVLGLTAHGIFQDLIVWGSLCLIFAVVFLIGLIKEKRA